MFLRYFAAFVIVAVIVAIVLWWAARQARNAANLELDPREKAKLIGNDAVKQLEELMHDPMAAHDPEWEKETEYIVNRWGSHPPRPRKKKY